MNVRRQKIVKRSWRLIWKKAEMFGEVIDTYIEFFFSKKNQIAERFPLCWFMDELPSYVRFSVAATVVIFLLVQRASSNKMLNDFYEQVNQLGQKISSSDISDYEYNNNDWWNFCYVPVNSSINIFLYIIWCVLLSSHLLEAMTKLVPFLFRAGS